jgi:TonB family protein
MLGPILDSLAFLHGQGLVHSHIKPSNVMVVGDRLKLPVDTVRRAGPINKTPAQAKIYDAPEVASGTIQPASDIWSLGITLVEALAQHPPASDKSKPGDPVVPAEIREPFHEIARGCLRFDPSKRATIRQIRSWLNPSPTLEEPANEMDQLAPAEMGASVPAYQEKTTSRGRLAAIIGAAVVVLAILVFALTRSHTPQPAPPAAQSPAPQATPPVPPPASPAPARSSGTVKAEVAERVMPDVSASANRTIRGKFDVSVRVDVDPSGTVANARLEAHGPSRYFASRALDAARKWKFRPAQQDGKAVPSTWLLRFQFRRSGPEVNAAEVSP